MADGIDGITENEILQPAVPVRAHDDEVGTDLARVADDFAAGRG